MNRLEIITEVKNKLSILRDKRTRVGWTESEANEHEHLMSSLEFLESSDSSYTSSSIIVFWAFVAAVLGLIIYGLHELIETLSNLI